MVDVKPADMSIAGPAEVVRLDVVIGHCANRCGPHDKAVFVVVSAGVVEVGQEAQLAGVTFPNQILPVNIGHVNLLVASAKFI